MLPRWSRTTRRARAEAGRHLEEVRPALESSAGRGKGLGRIEARPSSGGAPRAQAEGLRSRKRRVRRVWVWRGWCVGEEGSFQELVRVVRVQLGA